MGSPPPAPTGEGRGGLLGRVQGGRRSLRAPLAIPNLALCWQARLRVEAACSETQVVIAGYGLKQRQFWSPALRQHARTRPEPCSQPDAGLRQRRCRRVGWVVTSRPSPAPGRLEDVQESAGARARSRPHPPAPGPPVPARSCRRVQPS